MFEEIEEHQGLEKSRDNDHMKSKAQRRNFKFNVAFPSKTVTDSETEVRVLSRKWQLRNYRA